MDSLLISTGVVALAEMGDKTQIATIALAAHYAAPFAVVVGTTLSMLIADVPAVLIGNKFAEKNSKEISSLDCCCYICHCGCADADWYR